jgi:hypothetical protein
MSVVGSRMLAMAADPSVQHVVVFEDAIRASIERRFGRADPSVWPPVVALALDAARAPLRAWLDDEVSRMAPERLSKVLGQLRGDGTAFSAVAELAAGALLRDVAGLAVTHEPDLDGQTPDFVAHDSTSGQPVLIAEVETRGTNEQVAADQRKWLELNKAVGTIGSPVVLIAGISQRNGPPTHAEVASIVRHLKGCLPPGGRPVGWLTSAAGITFQVAHVTDSPKARLLPVSVFPIVDRDHVVNGINDKVGKYRSVANSRGLPLLVVLAAGPRSGLNATFVNDVLAGGDTMVVTINPAGTGIGQSRQHTLRQTDAPPLFDAALSAVGFIDVRDGYDAQLTMWPIDGAPRPLPILPLSDRILLRPPTGTSRRLRPDTGSPAE